MLKRNTTIFIVFAIVWEVIVAILYGVFIRYSSAADFSSMYNHGNVYPWSVTPTTTSYVSVNSTQPPFVYIVVVIAIALLIVGKPIFI